MPGRSRCGPGTAPRTLPRARGGARERRIRLARDARLVARRRRRAAYVIEELGRRGKRRLRGRCPFGLQLPRGGDGLLLALADHGHVVTAAHDAHEPRQAHEGRLVDAAQRCARERRAQIARVQHAGHLHVHGPDQRSVDLARNVVARHGLADDAQLLHGLHGGRAGRGVDVAPRQRNVETLPDELGIGDRFRRIGLGRDGAVADGELGDRRVQAIRTELEQHAPRFGGNPRHGPTVTLDGVGAARPALVGRDVRAAHDEARLVVGDVELVAHHLPERGTRPLAAICFADEERGRVVRMDHDPGVELAKVAVGIRTRTDRLQRARARRGLLPTLKLRTKAPDDREKAAARRRRVEVAQRVLDRFGKLQIRGSSDGSLGCGVDACRGGAAHDAFDRRLDAVVRHAAAERAFHAFADLGVAWGSGCGRAAPSPS